TSGNYRLRIGDADTPLQTQAVIDVAPDFGPNTHSSFATAHDIGPLGAEAIERVIRSSIDPQFFNLQLPGSANEPGHRDIAHILEGGRLYDQDHFIDPYGFSVFPIFYDEVSGPRTYYYAFPNRYGTVNGQP